MDTWRPSSATCPPTTTTSSTTTSSAAQPRPPRCARRTAPKETTATSPRCLLHLRLTTTPTSIYPLTPVSHYTGRQVALGAWCKYIYSYLLKKKQKKTRFHTKSTPLSVNEYIMYIYTYRQRYRKNSVVCLYLRKVKKNSRDLKKTSAYITFYLIPHVF